MIQVYTGDISQAGTDANVYITVFGERGDTGVRQLTHSKTHKNKFERGNVSSNPSFFFFFWWCWWCCEKRSPTVVSED